MNIEEKKKKDVEWYDNPDIITSLIIGLIALIVILSQSFAINNHLSAGEILSSILNHNIVYLLMCIYFVALKTSVGKRYFDFLNIFVIVLHSLTAITSLLTVFQSFGLGSLLGLAIDLLILIYMFHTFLRSTRVWKSMNLNKSPFNEISNSGYFSSTLVLAVTLLAVNLISTTSFDGTILALMDTVYTVLFVRYVFLYGEFLNNKKISINNVGNFDEIKEVIAENVNDFVDDVKEKAIDIKEDIVEVIDKMELDEKVELAKEKTTDFVNDVKEKAVDIKENIQEKIEESNFDEKIDSAKDVVKDFTEIVKEEIIDIKDDIQEKIIDIKDNDDVVVTKKVSSKPKNEITSRKKKTKKPVKGKESVKKGNQ